MTTPTILVFATGGTIGMRETEQGLAPDPDFEHALEAMVTAICAPLGVEHRINFLSPAIDSANADADTAPRIARTVRARVRTKKPDGVVITHGTDTLAFTAARVAFELAGLGVPVVFTGSQHPHTLASGDAKSNLSLAIRTALKASPSAPVSIAFGGKILPAVRATKFQADALAAFRAERPLGARPSGVPSQLQGDMSRSTAARVTSFRFVPGVTADDLRAAGAHPDGLVLECYGSGNAPMQRTGMAAALTELCRQKPVVAITQCATGGVDADRYAVGGELASTGVIDGADLTLEAALAKLSFALDAGLSGAPLRSLFALNLVGERS